MEYFFYIFFFSIIGFSISAVLFKNPVKCVLALIGAFLSASGLFILFSAEFIAMVLAILYVGAIAILFLFVVIMLNINEVGEPSEALWSKILAGVVVFIFMLVMTTLFLDLDKNNSANNKALVLDLTTMAHALYVDYFVLLELAGVILLAAMVGTISLTISKRSGVKRQSPYGQINRDSSVKLVNVKPFAGVDLNE